jgi:hypothetical protein
MSARRELAGFALVLGTLVAGFLSETLFGGKVLSPADVLFVSASFRDVKGPDYEPVNRLLTDPVLQFQPWLEFNRVMLRRGRLPLWNDLAGCGSPHLANSQSAVFDPFHLIAYLGTLPGAIAWIAAARLWFAGLGMFVLARSWGLGPWGRWFAGLTFPLSGFLVVWLLYPVTGVAVWMPWLFWASDRVLDQFGPRRVGVLAVVVGCVFLGGHVQTSAHVLLASGLYAGWRVVQGWAEGRWLGPIAAWSGGVGLGLAVAAVSIVPLWFYLGKSPVWADRERERPSPWRLTRPRVLDAVCTAVPYAFGSQRRGHPNLARAVGVHNLNESAGGFVGLATLIWLAPQGWRARRGRCRVGFLAGLTGFGFLAAFGFPPVVNLLRAVPVLNVTDLRRLTLWVAFGLTLLGGAGLDQLAAPWPRRTSRWWVSLWVAGAAALGLGSVAVRQAESWLRGRADAHYARASSTTKGADRAAYQRRSDRQVRQALDHLPRQLCLTAAELSALAALATLASRGVVPWSAARPSLLGLTVVELLGFGSGLNPAIDPGDDRPVPALIARLRDEVGRSGRVLGLGEELPPNVAMRYGLADPRNYDSVELSRNADWFEPLYEPGGKGRTSRRTVTWAGVLRARDRLREAGVSVVVAASAPPAGLVAAVERVGAVWLARLDTEPIVSAGPGAEVTSADVDHGRVEVNISCSRVTTLVVRHTYDAGWRAWVDGRPAGVEPHRGTFLSVRVGPGAHRVALAYDPPEARAARAASLVAAAVTVFALTGFRPIRSPRFRRQGLGRFRAVGLESGVCDLHRNTWPDYH